jgi:uncharacterized membrane protein YhaH (DUF805 family)
MGEDVGFGCCRRHGEGVMGYTEMGQSTPVILLFLLGLPVLVVIRERNKPSIARGPFIGRVLSAFVVAVLLIGVSKIEVLMLPAAVMLFLTAYFLFAITVRRLTDAGWNPWLSYILVVPIVSLIFLVVLFFVPHKARSGAGLDTTIATPEPETNKRVKKRKKSKQNDSEILNLKREWIIKNPRRQDTEEGSGQSLATHFIADELEKLSKLHKQGVLTDKEFNEQKARLFSIT